MDFNTSNIITTYLKQQEELFTLVDFYKYLKSQGAKISKAEAEGVLRSSNYVFPLVNQEFITRAGVFTGRWFSFKPSKEEIEKGYILLGHRCVPFVDNSTGPDSISLAVDGRIIDPETQSFSMNLAMDTFALFGEGYVLPYIFNDKGNKDLSLSSIQYSLPSEITLTAWPLKKITKDEKIVYGDRILCRVLDWEQSIVEVSLQKTNHKELTVSADAIEREEWYSYFEEDILKSIEKNGPSDSIDEQLSLLYLEYQDDLCKRNCGSIEEFLAHTSKIGFVSYGVESRIWKKNEEIPYSGPWNALVSSNDLILSEIAVTFSPHIIDAFLENRIYEESKNADNSDKENDIEGLITKIFPQLKEMSASERKLVLLNIEKRNDILKNNYNRFSDYSIAETRKRVLELFTQVNTLFFEIGCSGVKVENFPQHELVILSQLYGHIVNILEELEIEFLRDRFPVADVELSLNGMEDTFDEIKGSLESVLKVNRFKGFEILK
ncbi:MAG: hypothetical protein K6C97_09590 [Treponema sp.]|nr:hypothetical protein [Treponema sp.]